MNGPHDKRTEILDCGSLLRNWTVKELAGVQTETSAAAASAPAAPAVPHLSVLRVDAVVKLPGARPAECVAAAVVTD